MKSNSGVRCGRHCVFKLHVHGVFAAKYRRRVFDKSAIDALRGIFASVCRDFAGHLKSLLRTHRPDLRKRYWKDVLWLLSYFAASCGGAPVSIVRQYIEQQRTPD